MLMDCPRAPIWLREAMTIKAKIGFCRFISFLEAKPKGRQGRKKRYLQSYDTADLQDLLEDIVKKVSQDLNRAISPRRRCNR
jgi:hypothetical protein